MFPAFSDILLPMFRSILCCLALSFLYSFTAAADAPRVVLAENAKAKLPIFISAEASEEARASAKSLADMLGKISGAEFLISSEENDSASIRLEIKGDSAEREHYTIQSGPNGLILTGTTELALSHAIWDLLHRFGYRQFFPGEKWEIIPKINKLEIAINSDEKPAYQSRRIWAGFGLWKENRAAWQDWNARNRMADGMKLNTGHAYGRIIRAKQAVFDAHPEYYALLGGKRNVRPSAKLCIGNPEVQKLAADYGVEYFENDPEADCVSVDPSDGGGWCECDLCTAIGPASDRALLLANEVATAVTAKFPGKFVGMYAYNVHSTPPSLKVHPNVVISVATAFIKGGQKVEDIMSGWAEKGATLGVREYYSVSTWDRDMPGRSRGSNLEYLAKSIPDFHQRSGRYMTSEASDNWGCNGLGYYFASRVLWDLDAAENRDEIVEDFLEKSFGPAKEPMRKFYAIIDGSNKRARLVFEDQLARMFRQLADARTLAGDDEAIQGRVTDLTLYTRYAELYDRYRKSRGKERQSAYEAMIKHAYRIRGTYMVHSLGLYRDVNRRDKAITVPKNAMWNVPEEENPWKSSKPFSHDEIEEIIGSGVANHQSVELDFEPKEFSDENLVPLPAGRNSGELKPGKAETARSMRSWFTVIENAPAEIELNITGGLITHYRDRGNVKIQLWKLGGASETGERKTLIAEDASVPPDGKQRSVKFQLRESGTYRIDLTDNGDLTRVTWPEGQRMSWKMAIDDFPQSMSGRWHLYFYVPKGTERIGLYSSAAAGQLLRPDGKPALDLKTSGGGFLSTKVPKGMDDRLWKFSNAAGKICLLNVPPFLAKSAEELVIPKN